MSTQALSIPKRATMMKRWMMKRYPCRIIITIIITDTLTTKVIIIMGWATTRRAEWRIMYTRHFVSRNQTAKSRKPALWTPLVQSMTR